MLTLEFLLDYGLFLAKIVTVVVAIVAILVLAKAVGGKSGGRPDMAQGGGSDVDALPTAIESVFASVEEKLT